MLLFSQVAVLLLLAIIAGVFLVMLRKSSGGDSGTSSSPWPWKGETDTETVIAPAPPVLIVEQLNPKTMKRVKEFPVREIPKDGVSISRPNAKRNNKGILLSKATEEASTVSDGHAVIALDAEGMFIQDCGSTNGTFNAKHQKVDEAMNITDGLIVYLGKQPLRFSIPGSHNDEWHNDTEAGINFFDGNIPNAPVTVVRRKKR